MEKVTEKFKETIEIFQIKNLATTSALVDFIGSVFFMTLTYFLGTSGYSIFWIGVLIIGLYFREKLWRKRQKHLMSLTKAGLREKEMITKTLAELPAWVQFPDVERVEWMNKVIRQSWPYIGIYMQSFIREFIEPQVKAAMPRPFKSFQFKSIDMGDIPMKVANIKVFTENVAKDEIVMDMNVVYAGDCDIVVSVGAFSGGLRKMEFAGRLRAILKPLIPMPPLIGGVTAFFLDDPVIDFELTGIGELATLPGLAGAIKSITTSQVRSICVLPNVIVVPLTEGIDIVKLNFPEPDGILRIHVVEAEDLENRDVIGQSDPYVTLSVGAQSFKTSVINDELNPCWNEFFQAVVGHASGQKIQLELFDEDKTGQDDELGCLTLEINTVREKGMVDAWYPLEAAKQGRLHLILYWMDLSPIPRDLEEIRKEAEWLRKWEVSANVETKSILPPSVLMVYVDKIVDLPSIKRGRDPSPLVELSVGKKTVRSLPVMSTRDPVYQQKFIFFVEDPEFQTLKVEAKDDASGKKSLGVVVVPITQLVTVPNMEMYQCKWQMSSEDHLSTIVMTLRLRSLKAAKIPGSEGPFLVDPDVSRKAKFERSLKKKGSKWQKIEKTVKRLSFCDTKLFNEK